FLDTLGQSDHANVRVIRKSKTTITLVSAKSGSFPLSKAPGQECYEAFLTPMPLHTLGQMCSHRRLFPQWACRHGDLGKIHAQQHPTQAPTRRTAVPIPKARGHCHR